MCGGIARGGVEMCVQTAGVISSCPSLLNRTRPHSRPPTRTKHKAFLVLKIPTNVPAIP